MSRPRIIVVGSYVVGLTIRAPRFPVAGETLIGSDFDLGPGGKGSNQAVGATRLGADVCLLVKIGQDTFAQTALELYQTEGIDTEHVIQVPGASTGVAFITLNAAGENHIILDIGANDLLSPADVDALEAEIAQSDVVMSVMEIRTETAARAMALGKQHGAITILNPAPARPLPDEVLGNIDVLTPNETELRILLGLAPDEPGDVIAMARRIQARGVSRVVVTRGGSGALILDSDGMVTEVPGVKVDVVDTTGAGDALNAALATALGMGKSLVEAARFAVIAGGLACTKLGVIPALPYRSQIDDQYS
jgi:ribokinase